MSPSQLLTVNFSRVDVQKALSSLELEKSTELDELYFKTLKQSII